MGKKDTDIPAAPDPTQVARQQAQFNRVNVTSPFGSVLFEGPDRSNARIALNPRNQRILNLAFDQASQPIAPLDTGQVRNDIFQAFQNRITPEFQQRRAALQNQLVQNGIPAVGADLAPGAVSELDVLGRQENDALTQAFLQSQGIAAQQRLADIQGTAAGQQQAVNNALSLGGGQVLGAALNVNPVDLTGALQLQQNQQLAQAKINSEQNAGKGSLFGTLGSAALLASGVGAPAALASGGASGMLARNGFF